MRVGLAELVAELDEQVGANPLPTVPRNPVQAGGSFVLFGVLTATFGVPVESVATVLQIPRLCRLPNLPPWLAGVFYASGSVTPLLTASSIPKLLEAGDFSSVSTVSNGDSGAPRRCLVIGAGEIQIGLEVDEVFGVYRLELAEGRGRVLESWGEDSLADSSDRGARLSDTLHWRVAEQAPLDRDGDTGAPASGDASGLGNGRLGEGGLADGGLGEVGRAVEIGSDVRVLSLAGLLASDELTRFANRAALVRAMNVAWDSATGSAGSEAAP